MRALCVYCGSNSGFSPEFAARAASLGKLLAEQKIRLIYGGGNVGLMGTIANATLAANGEVFGVIPKALVDKEVAHKGLTHLEIVDSMHARKARIFELADGFVALPGGFGTLDEIFEMLTWRQLGISNYPCAFLDVAGFYSALMKIMDMMVQQGFLRPEQRSDMWYGEDAEAMLRWMEHYQPRSLSKWIPNQTALLAQP